MSYDGIRFFIPLAEVAEEDKTETYHVVHGTHCKKTNKKRLRKYFKHMGIPIQEHKRVMKELGFVGSALGR